MNKAELQGLEMGYNLEALTGTVISLYPQKHGQGWSVTNGMLKLETGEQVAIAFWNRDVAHLKGKHVVLRGVEEKGGTVKRGEVKGGNNAGNLQIDVGEKALIESSSAPTSAPASRPAATRGAPAAQPHAHGPQSLDDILDLYNRIYSKVLESSPEEERGDKEHMRGITACIFIEANKKAIYQ